MVIRFPRYLSATLALLSCALCISIYHYFGHTWDEPEHLAAGMQLLDQGLYTYDIQHPPLARLAMAVGPYLAGARSFGDLGPSGDQEGRDLLYRTGNYDRILTLARLGVLPFLILMLVATWAWGRHLLGEVPAALAVFWLATLPTLLGHAALATLDVPGAAMDTLALYLSVRWFETPTWPLSLLLGMAGGLAVGTKLSAIPFLGLCLPAMGAMRLVLGAASQPAVTGTPGRLLARGAGAAVAAVLVLVLVYGGRFENFSANLPIPVPMALEKLTAGIQLLTEHNQEGHLSFLLGEVRTTGWWYFYPVALAVKTPLPLLLLGIPGLGLLAGRGVRDRDWRLVTPAACFAVVLVFCCAFSRINIGIRHVLILYPPLALGAVYASTLAWQSRGRVAKPVLVALLVWQTGSLWTAYPDYLPYFNELARRRPEAVLIDSDLDWGQDLHRLERALHARRVPSLSFVFRGNADWLREDLPTFTFLPPHIPTTGWVAVDLLAKMELAAGGDGYAWLDAYVPVARIGKTIDLYFIPPPAPTGQATIPGAGY